MKKRDQAYAMGTVTYYHVEVNGNEYNVEYHYDHATMDTTWKIWDVSSACDTRIGPDSVLGKRKG